MKACTGLADATYMVLNAHARPDFGQKLAGVWVIESPEFPVYSVQKRRSGGILREVCGLKPILV